MQCVALGTSATFSYLPTEDEMRKYLALKRGKVANALKDHHLTDEEKKEAKSELLEAERNRPIADRKTAGDASESGLIKFVNPIWNLDEYRRKYPTFSYEQDGKTIEALIPFSSEIKFNMFIKDMNKAERNPSNLDDGLMVIMKGAPERILRRCSKILIKGEERDFDEDARKEVNAANDSLGKLGERVLAFARYKLEPGVFTKEPPYQFDIKGWKKWMNV